MAFLRYFIKMINKSWKSNFIFKFNNDNIFLKKSQSHNIPISSDFPENI